MTILETPATIRDIIRRRNEVFIMRFNAGDGVGVANLYTPGAQ